MNMRGSLRDVPGDGDLLEASRQQLLPVHRLLQGQAFLRAATEIQGYRKRERESMVGRTNESEIDVWPNTAARLAGWRKVTRQV